MTGVAAARKWDTETEYSKPFSEPLIRPDWLKVPNEPPSRRSDARAGPSPRLVVKETTPPMASEP